MKPLLFESTDIGAPALTGTVGALLPILRATLIQGFNPKTVTQIVVTDGVAVASCADHGYSADMGKRVTLSGSPVSELNGDKQLTEISVGTFTFATSAANGTYVGSVSAVRSTPGWTEPFSGTNKAVFRIPNPLSTRFYLRVDDTIALKAGVSAYEHMSDVDSGVNKFPTQLAQFAWTKTPDAVGGSRYWSVLADDYGFYITISYSATYLKSMHTKYFGDYVSYSDGNKVNAYLCGEGANSAYDPCGVGISNQLNSTLSEMTIANCSGVIARNTRNDKSVLVQSRGIWSGYTGQSTIESGSNFYTFGYNNTDRAEYANSNTKILCDVGLFSLYDVLSGEMPGLKHHTLQTYFTTLSATTINGSNYIQYPVTKTAKTNTDLDFYVFLISLEEWNR